MDLTALIRAPFVGKRAADVSDLSDGEYASIIATTVFYLAEQGILYTDLRPFNIRIDDEHHRVFLIDYDDCVLLNTNVCCGSNLLELLKQNSQ